MVTSRYKPLIRIVFAFELSLIIPPPAKSPGYAVASAITFAVKVKVLSPRSTIIVLPGLNSSRSSLVDEGKQSKVDTFPQ